MPGSVMWFDGPLSVRRPATGRHLPLLRLSFTVRDEWFAGRWCHRATSSWYNGTIDLYLPQLLSDHRDILRTCQPVLDTTRTVSPAYCGTSTTL
jgi:hypothetical protein